MVIDGRQDAIIAHRCASGVFERTIGRGKEGLGLIDQILYGRARTYYDSNLMPNTFVLSQYRNQFNSLRAAVYFWTASMFGNSSIPPKDH
jgi:hypothetical protein